MTVHTIRRLAPPHERCHSRASAEVWQQIEADLLPELFEGKDAQDTITLGQGSTFTLRFPRRAPRMDRRARTAMAATPAAPAPA